jgi:hypothetical protein
MKGYSSVKTKVSVRLEMSDSLEVGNVTVSSFPKSHVSSVQKRQDFLSSAVVSFPTAEKHEPITP